MPRYFIAVIPPAAYSSRIVAFQKTHPENWLVGEVEPHITVKAPNGLSDDLEWLKPVKRVCGSFYPFTVKISEPESFGKSVLFLKISSPGILELHRKLAGLFDPSPAEILENFELDYYIPHISLAIVANGLSEELIDIVRKEANSQFTLPLEFKANFARITRIDDRGKYCKFEDIPFKRNNSLKNHRLLSRERLPAVE
jgi:2'-5' RNA ligase